MIYVVIGGFVVCVAWLGFLTWKLNAFISDKKQTLESIEEHGLDAIVETQNKKLNKVLVDTEQLYGMFDEQNNKLSVSVNKCGVVRYNPFSGEGGNQSFVVALLNDNDDGVVISSLYSRSGGSRIFAKELENGKSDISLTKEEEEAIKKAK